MAKSKEDLIAAYKMLKASLGKSPSMAEFTNETEVGRHTLERLFGSNAWAKLVKICGDNPKDFLREKSDLNEILTKYRNLARELGKVPTGADLKYRDW